MERMDSGALFALTGDPAQGRTLADLNDDRFERALAVELGNLTLPGERERAEQLGEEYRAFGATLARVLAADRAAGDPPPALLRRAPPPLPGDQAARRRDPADEPGEHGGGQRARPRIGGAGSAADGAGAPRGGRRGGRRACSFSAAPSSSPCAASPSSAREIEAGQPRPPRRSSRPATSWGGWPTPSTPWRAGLREVRRSDRYRLLRAQQTSQLAIDSLPAAVVLLSPAREVELANRAAGILLRARPGEPLDERGAGWLRPLLDGAERGKAAAPEEGYGAAVQLFVDGRERFFLPHAVPLRDADGRSIGTTLILSDVTELRRLDEMKTDLVSTVSHELLTPLTSIAMAIHILLEDDGGAAERRADRPPGRRPRRRRAAAPHPRRAARRLAAGGGARAAAPRGGRRRRPGGGRGGSAAGGLRRPRGEPGGRGRAGGAGGRRGPHPRRPGPHQPVDQRASPHPGGRRRAGDGGGGGGVGALRGGRLRAGGAGRIPRAGVRQVLPGSRAPRRRRRRPRPRHRARDRRRPRRRDPLRERRRGSACRTAPRPTATGAAFHFTLPVARPEIARGTRR